MNSRPKTLLTWNVKKNNRSEAKKRKLEALLNLFEKTEIPETKVANNSDSLEKNYKILKNELQKYVKKANCRPSFFVTELGSRASLDFKLCNETASSSRTISPLFIEDIYHLLLKSLLGHLAPFPVNWCKLENPQTIDKTVLIVVEDLPKSKIIENISELSSFTDIFPFQFEFASANVPFVTELSALHLVSDVCTGTKRAFSSLFPVKKRPTEKAIDSPKTFSKLHLLLSPIQLVMEHYPLPHTLYQHSKSIDYVFTKDLYSPVTADSPLFALDCEMCRVAGDKSEVTRIAVVNEKLETVYQSLVKPTGKVTSYMTKFSGVTKEMLADVQTSLSDVQKVLQTILPSDAILCGQSLNCDLHALKMIHPYVIDTSVIFNVSGVRGHKSSLKSLTLKHLKETIQVGINGHNPVEDSIASMKLVQLKLGNNIQYGDAVLSENISLQAKDKNCNNSAENLKSVNECSSNSKSELKKEDGFFYWLKKFSKKIVLIGEKDSLNHYAVDMLPEGVAKIQKSNPRKVGNAVSSNVENFDLTVGHLVCKTDGAFLNELNAIIRQIYASCPTRTLCIVVTSGVNNTIEFQEIKNGICMIVLKKV